MSIKSFQIHLSLADALCSVIPAEKTYQVVRHKLKAGEKVRAHYHKIAREWIVINQGQFEVIIDEVINDFDPNFVEEFIVIPLPKKSVHAFTAKTDVSYFVIRDKKDRIYYPKKMKRKCRQRKV